MTHFYFVLVVGGTDPELYGPYKTAEARDKEAKEVWNNDADHDTDGIFRASSEGELSIGSFVGDELEDSGPFDDVEYMLCEHCDHFVDCEGDGFIHLEDGEQEFDHNPEPSGKCYTGAEWKKLRPDLFVEHLDGAIGPNSLYHSRRGKIDSYEDGEVIGEDANGMLIRWNAETKQASSCSETREQFGEDQLTDAERERL